MDQQGLWEGEMGKAIFAVILLLALILFLVSVIKLGPQILEKIAGLRRLF